MYKLEFLSLAKEDMDNIINYISHELKNKNAALNLANDFINQTNNILLFPYSNPIYSPFKKLKNEYRVDKIKNFLMFYIINEDKKIITIVRVIYNKRNIENLLD